MGDDIPPLPPVLSRTTTDGGIPVFHAADVRIIDRPAMNFDNMPCRTDNIWFGPMVFEIQGEKCTLVQFLNYGAEGQAYLAVQESSGRKFVCKFCVEKNSLEIEILKKMPRELVMHPNFLTYEMLVIDVESILSPAKHIIFMDYIPNGELFEFIASGEKDVQGKPVSEGTARRFIHDVVCGMAECYRFGVTHRDLKPENLMINEEGRIIIIDLGHAKRVPAVHHDPSAAPPPEPLPRAATNHRYGTAAFNAPEVASGRKYDCEPVDVWSLGVIAFMLHAKLPPFSQAGGVASWGDCVGPDNAECWRKIERSGYYAKFDDSLKAFINCAWRTDPQERPSFRQLEAAVHGDENVIAAFPGLQWLAQPVNDEGAFYEELRMYCPSKKFQSAKENLAPRRW